MVALLRFRSVTRTVRLELPDGTSRQVKVTTNDAKDVQQIEDGDALHATVIPAPVAVRVSHPVKQRRPLLIRNLGMPRIRQRYDRDQSTGIWKPDALFTARQIKHELDPPKEAA